ncbi:MAG TPA: hypothetical protein IGS53_19600 [Leptolyngbyaceae cyanobacterium M33_DOE_097]|nr:hypothetical protein [Leptolyngbyaceae cyanobacterium M33_DOE_097]
MKRNKGEVGTLLRRLKRHFAFYAEPAFSAQMALAKAIALTTSASRHPSPLSAIELPNL